MEKSQMFCIYLPDPNAPFYSLSLALYVGTHEEILQFIDRLEALTKAPFYKNVIAAVRAYPDDPEASYEIAGRKYPAMVPVTEIGRKEFSLSDHTWIHKGPCDSARHLMSANYIGISYIIITNGTWTATCCKAHFEGLSVSAPGLGGVAIGSVSKGTPGLFYHEGINDGETLITEMSLYRSERWYSKDKTAPTVDDLPGPLSADFPTVIGELLGRC